MKLFTRLAVTALGLLALVATAAAQDDFERGKTGAQLYASDCAICHKSAQQLRNPGGLFGLRGFLDEHYTASREASAKIAAYVEGLQRDAGRGTAERPHKRRSSAAKEGGTKPAEKTSGAKAEAAKAPGSKPSGNKSEAEKKKDEKK
jgi:hypothetical protein